MSGKAEIEELPTLLQQFIIKYPELWENYERLGESSTRAGPLPKKYVHLIKLAVHGARDRETPFKSHVRFALKEGASWEEVEHGVIQLLTSEGIGTVVKLLRWAKEAKPSG